VLAVLVVPSVRQPAEVREPAVVCQPGGGAGPETGAFHDHEGFTTPWSIKVFAIMETML
jgi:hypothetical protein